MESKLEPGILLLVIAGYFLMLIAVSWFTSRDQSNSSFFLGKRKSPWYLVAIGMIGATLSGVTFISIPGWVGGSQFSYMQMVFGYLLGYLVIGTVLMPMYYRLGLTSIYGYLEQRLGKISYKTGAAYFILSRVIGAAFRLYLIALILDAFVLGPLGMSFPMTVGVTIFLIWIYTFRGGIRTIIFTDTLQTVFMLSAVVLTIFSIAGHFENSIGEMIEVVRASEYSDMFFFGEGWSERKNFFKRFLAGAFIALVMTGLDQDMMQKNLSCKNIGEAQKNMFWFSIVLVIAKLCFLFLGALLFLYMADIGMEMPTRIVNGEVKEATDLLYPTIAMNHLPVGISLVFILGLMAAAYSSADSALTALTTSFCVDFLDFEKKEELALSQSSDPKDLRQAQKKTRTIVHIGFSVVLFIVILVFWGINNDAVISEIFTAAGYTYGPLLGLFAFGFLTKRMTIDKWVWLVCLLSPILTFIVVSNSESWFGYVFDFEHLILNGLITFGLLYAMSLNMKQKEQLS